VSTNERVLSGRYELSDLLGSGGMAEVFLGRDRVLGRTIAAKILHNHFAGDPQFIARFRREAQSAAALNHPNIVSVYDTGSDDGTHYIVMEYIEGRTLRDVIREEGPLLPERAAEIAGDVCAALAFAHSHGIVHRDVKPANIMLTKNGELKVTDFGIARAASSETVTQTATVLGTAQYFSPEQAQAGQVDARSDIYSLGVVLYEMLTRQVPFTGSSPVAIAYKHVKEDPILPSRLNPDIPPALESIVMKALAKNPDNRYQNAQEMRQDLMRAASGKPVHATPVMAPIDHTAIAGPAATDATVMIQRTGSPADRQRRRRTGWILLTVIMLAIAGIVTWAILSALPKTAPLVTVPDVRGKTSDEARTILEGRKLKADPVCCTASVDVPQGSVIDQTPPPDQQIKEGESVRLIISGGPQNVVVPDVRRKPFTIAKTELEGKGLKVVIARRNHATVPKDQVISQSIPAGTTVPAGQTITLTVSDGPKKVPVPTVEGETEEQAKSELVAAGFKVTVVHSTEGSCLFTPGRVCDQSPAGGTQADEGSTVVITVGEGATESPTPTPT
jgi:eukaryotic-like serine/threonine-protein kinase